ncbi:MAG: patatin family protein [Ruminococcus sp.]|nr:patatin family protein [Ruminococcus sp.]
MVGLVLEGGAMRGMYTAGVLDILMEHGLQFDVVIGVSAGAAFGVNYLSKQKGRVIRYNKRFNADKNYMGICPLLKEGNIINTKYAYEIVPHQLDVFDDDTFQASGVPFYAVVTNVDNGNSEYILVKSVFEQMDALRASGSMPFVSKPVEIDGKRYLDGGISDSIPFEFARSLGCDKIVVVLTRDVEYRKKPMSKLLVRTKYGVKSALSQRLMKRHEIYNNAVEQLKILESEEKAFVIRPSAPIEIKRMEKDPDKLQAVYDMGTLDCKKVLEDLKKYIFKSK